jgi:uroporphyrinogen-III synthase
LDKNKFVLITRPEEEGKKLADILNKKNIKSVIFPTIKTIPLEIDKSLDDILKFDIFIFGSSKAVRYFFEKFPVDKLKNKEFIAVGKKTAERLKKFGLQNIKYPKDEFTSEAVLKLIRNNWEYYKNKKILFPKSKIGTKVLENNLDNVYPLHIYDTKTNYPENKEFVKNLLENKKISFIVFSSPSTFRGFIEIYPKDWRKYLSNSYIIAIGKITAKALEEKGINNYLLPKKSTNEDIAELIYEWARYLE